MYLYQNGCDEMEKESKHVFPSPRISLNVIQPQISELNRHHKREAERKGGTRGEGGGGRKDTGKEHKLHFVSTFLSK